MVNKLGMDGYKCIRCGVKGCDGNCINKIIEIFDVKPNKEILKDKCIRCGVKGCNGSCKIDIINIIKQPKIEEILRFDEKLDFKKLPNLDDLICISQEKIKELKNKLKEILGGIDLEKMNESELGSFLKYLGVSISLLGNDLSIYEGIKGKNDFQKKIFEKKVDKLDKILTKQPTNFVQEKVIEATSIIKGMIYNLDILSGEQIKEIGYKLNLIGIDITTYINLKGYINQENIIKKEV